MNQNSKTPPTLRDQFLLDPNVVFLNHGSFGAVPRVVFQAYEKFTTQLELQPVRFLQRDGPLLLATARSRLADFIGSDADEVVFVPNPTFAANEIARSLPLGPGDELLTTNQEYGACLFAFRYMSQKNGFDIVEHQLPIPSQLTNSKVHHDATNSAVADEFWQSVTPNTKAIFVSHITAKTVMTLPVADICRKARKAGITTFVDGAHAPGQIDLDLHAIDADFYTGACHKWLMAPKGASFLYARRDQQHRIEPLVVGWGWGDDRTINVGSDFLDMHEWLGTRNPAAYFSVPAAIDFQLDHDWQTVRANCRGLARSAVERAVEITGMPPICDASWHHQMGIIELPTKTDVAKLQQYLYDNHQVEVPAFNWRERAFLRISVQGYNSEQDIDQFLAALKTELTIT